MKVLFAVSNDNVSSSIIKKYQEKYKEIITSKNVYYFNAIIKELQKDKTYDAVVIGEDLEPISNNNYDTIDKFLFDKLDNISDEAYKATGEDIPIILICSDRRTKSDELLIKLFGIGIYNALLGNDRSVDNVCNLINKPRSKKEAKNYYKIDADDVNYKPENESEVSETEIKNILNHYKKIGNNEKKCVESFDSIASQYNDTQLRIIVKFLPNQVKQILERSSNRYQKLINGGTVLSNGKYTPYSPLQKNVRRQDTDFLTKDIEKPNLTKPVIIPSTMNIDAIKPTKVERPMPPANSAMQNFENANIGQGMNYNSVQNVNSRQNINSINQNQVTNQPIQQNQQQIPQTLRQENAQVVAEQPQLVEPQPTPVKRRGRPRKINIEAQNIGNQVSNNINTVNPVETQVMPEPAQKEPEVVPVKRGRGRPKKVNVVAEDLEQNNSINNLQTNNQQANTTQLPNTTQTAIAQQNDFNLFDLVGNDENIEQNNNAPQDSIMQNFDNTIQNNVSQNFDNTNQNNVSQNVQESNDINLFDIAEEENNVPTNLFGLDNQEENTTVSNTSNTTASQSANPYDVNTQIESPYEMNNFESNPYDTNSFENPYEASTNTNPYEASQATNLYDANLNETPYMANNEQTNQYEQEPNYMGAGNTKELSRVSKETNVVQSNFVAQNKIVAFVGTSKNGTSFIVNNLAELLAQKGIKTAILDLTKNKNSYYMFTDNDQNLMQIATQSIKNLTRGVAGGVEVNKNLTVYTSLPDEDDETENFEAILQTLDNNYSAILMDCDFDTNINYFVKATEIYLVQSMDALTIQPLTQFLSELKLKNVLDETKLRVVLNKEMKLKILNDKMILGGMAKYNEPSMTLQRDLFNPATIKYVSIPFEMQTYARYLEAIALCQISLSGYSQTFLASLEKLANMVYPLIPGGGNYTNYSPNYEKAEKKGFFKSKNKKQPPTQFSSGVNDTLNKMRTNY